MFRVCDELSKLVVPNTKISANGFLMRVSLAGKGTWRIEKGFWLLLAYKSDKETILKYLAECLCYK